MSQAHIPQPDATAPGEQIQSTDSVLPMRSIEVTAPSTSQEIVPALGELNQLDPFFYNQFRQIAKIRWTVQDVAGKLLWYIPINPLAMDKNLAYVSRMYLAWDGDFIFNFKVAGTGFHAGLLTFVKTPPTIHPEKLTNPMDFTIMPWDAVDPKMLEIGSMYGRDIRPIKYHYMQKQENAPDDYYIGGYLALFVDIPLNTSSSGTPRIEIAIWVKNAPNFRVGWMVPYDLQNLDPPAIAPACLSCQFDFRHNGAAAFLSSYPTKAEKIVILPSSIKVINKNIFNCYMTDGSAMSKFNESGVKEIIAPLIGTATRWTETEFIALMSDLWMGIPAQGAVAILGNDKRDGLASLKDITFTVTGKQIRLNASVIASAGAPSEEQRVFIYFRGYPADTSIVDNEYKAYNNDESFLGFQADKYWCPQLYGFSTLLANSKYNGLDKWFSNYQTPVFQVYEEGSNLPLFFARLNQNGIFTTAAQKDQVEFDLNSLKFKFVFFLPNNESLPGSANLTDFRMASYYHKKVLKKKFPKIREY